jgi:hypothetical protein
MTRVTVSHFMKLDTAVSILISEHGDDKAHRVALREQQNARRSRSRKRFAFWIIVASEIDARRLPKTAPLPARAARAHPLDAGAQSVHAEAGNMAHDLAEHAVACEIKA